jgi:hypothetical protein
MSEPLLRVISFGVGTQSSKLIEGAAVGEYGPMPDCAIYSNTQDDPDHVRRRFEEMSQPGRYPFPIYEVTAGDLWASATRVRRTRDGQRSYIETAVPVYLKDGLKKGLGQRHCTLDFKIDPVARKCRELLGRKRITKKSGVLVEMWIGISADEAHRAKPHKYPWIKNRFPLLEKNESRADCEDWFTSRGRTVPLHDDNAWLDLTPAEFAECVQAERDLQIAYAATSAIDGIPYLHDSRVPLDQVKLVRTPVARKLRQFNMKFGNECEGMCGV